MSASRGICLCLKKKAWAKDVENWEFAGMGKHYLSYISRVAGNWSYKDAMRLVDNVRGRRLLRGVSGRQSSHTISLPGIGTRYRS